MIKREEMSNEASCLNRAHPEEPLFVLRANDPNAADTVRHWAESYRDFKTLSGRQMTDREMGKYSEAREIAAKMEHWRVNAQ